jgi:hypothetical protein
MNQNSMWARALAAFVALLALGGCDPEARDGDAGGACICAAECERVIDTPGGAEGCGGRNTIVDAQGCERAACTAASQCGEGERCYPVGLSVGDTVFDPFLGCGPSDFSLLNHQLPMEGRCVDATEFSETGDCPMPATCTEIWNFGDSIGVYGVYAGSPAQGGRLEGEALDIVLACLDRLGQEALAIDCAFPQWPPPPRSSVPLP